MEIPATSALQSPDSAQEPITTKIVNRLERDNQRLTQLIEDLETHLTRLNGQVPVNVEPGDSAKEPRAEYADNTVGSLLRCEERCQYLIHRLENCVYAVSAI